MKKKTKLNLQNFLYYLVLAKQRVNRSLRCSEYLTKCEHFSYLQRKTEEVYDRVIHKKSGRLHKRIHKNFQMNSSSMKNEIRQPANSFVNDATLICALVYLGVPVVSNLFLNFQGRKT